MSANAEMIVAEEVTAELAPAGQIAGRLPTGVLTAQQRRTRVVWLNVLGAVYVISVLVPRSSLPHVPLCWLHAATGLSCPTCGVRRAFTEIGHGNFAAALELNVMSVPMFLVGLALAAALWHELRSNRNWLAAWIVRRRVALILIGAAGVLLRYAPLL